MGDFFDGLKPLLEGLGIQPAAYGLLLAFGIVHQFACGYLLWWTRSHSFLSAMGFALLFGVGGAVQERAAFTAGATHTVALLAAALLAEAAAAQLAKVVPWIPRYNEKVANPPPDNQGGFMKLRLMLLLMAIVALVALAPVAGAQAKVFKLYAGANGVWNDTPRSLPNDFEVGLNARASLQPHISLVGSGVYGINGEYVAGKGGIRFTATDVENPSFSIGLGAQYRLSNDQVRRPDELLADVAIGIKPWPGPLVVGIFGEYGTKSNQAGAGVALRYQLFER